MCKCRYAEFVCSCTKDACPHNNPDHIQYHTSHNIWQFDHFEWKYCSSVLLDSHTYSSGIISTSPGEGTIATMKKTVSVSMGEYGGRAKDILLQTFKLRDHRNEMRNNEESSHRSTDTHDVHSYLHAHQNKKSTLPPRPPRPADDGDLRLLLSGGKKVNSHGRRLVGSYSRASLEVPIGASDDPRHGGEIPDCDEILYEGIRTRWTCGFCNEYWIGRTGLI